MSSEIAVIHATHASYEKIEPDTIHLHEHDVYEMMIFMKINGVFFMEGRAYRLHKNDVLLIPPNIQHRIIMDSPSEYDRYDMLIDQSRLPRELREMLPAINHIIRMEDHVTDALLESYDLYMEKFDTDRALVGIDAIVKNLLMHMYVRSKGTELKETSRVSPIVTRATAYIQKNLATLTGVEEICDELFVTKSHLHHLFKKYLMTTPKKYVISKRLFEAQRLIRTGMLPTEVYTVTGFGDYATFYRNYRSFFGHSPSVENELEIKREQYF